MAGFRSMNPALFMLNLPFASKDERMDVDFPPPTAQLVRVDIILGWWGYATVMTIRNTFGWVVLLSGLIVASASLSHSGGLNAEGCHNDRKNGGYHCHRGSRANSGSTSRPQALTARSQGAYANCAPARAAGDAPVQRGDPGYGAHLDRDNDGVGCER